MFQAQVPRPHDRPVGGGLVSVLTHATIVVAAVAATARTATVVRPPRVEGPIIFVPDDRSHDAPPIHGGGATLPSAPLVAEPTLTLNSFPPVRIPPPAPGPFDPDRFALPPVRAGAPPATDSARIETRVFTDRLVDERPVLIGRPALRYPEILKEAGIEGTVVLEAVVDTTGRVERGSVRIVAGANPLFEAAAREAIAGARYRPGRLDGRAVRVLVTQPVVFRLAARSATL